LFERTTLLDEDAGEARMFPNRSRPNLGYSIDAMGRLNTSQTDNISGEQVVYTYDALNRLASATATGRTKGTA
jgi:YD repeat-containing protein